MFYFWKIFFNTSLVKSWLVAFWFLLLNFDSSWCLFFNLDLELVDSILTSLFWAFCHHQNYLNHTWFIIMKLASTISPFLMMTTLKSRNTYTIYCNWLHHLKINWNITNSVKSFWNQTFPLVIDYQRVKTLVT